MRCSACNGPDFPWLSCRQPIYNGQSNKVVLAAIEKVLKSLEHDAAMRVLKAVVVLCSQGLVECAERRRSLAEVVENAASLPSAVARLVAAYML